MKRTRNLYPDRLIFGTFKAAEYLGIALSTLKHHLYVTHKLRPDEKIGEKEQTLVFVRSTLDEFLENRERERAAGKPGRPPLDVEAGSAS